MFDYVHFSSLRWHYPVQVQRVVSAYKAPREIDVQKLYKKFVLIMLNKNKFYVYLIFKVNE
jgi:hypothetical protein